MSSKLQMNQIQLMVLVSLLLPRLWQDRSPCQECFVVITLPSASFWKEWKLCVCAAKDQVRREICRAPEAKGMTNQVEDMQRDES